MSKELEPISKEELDDKGINLIKCPECKRVLERIKRIEHSYDDGHGYTDTKIKEIYYCRYCDQFYETEGWK